MKHIFRHNDNREEYRQEHIHGLMEAGHRSYCKIGNTTPPQGCLSVAEMAAWLQGNKKAKAAAKAVFNTYKRRVLAP